MHIHKVVHQNFKCLVDHGRVNFSTIAKITGESRCTVGAWYTGDKPISLENLDHLCTGFGLDTRFFFYDRNSPAELEHQRSLEQ